EEIKPVEKQEEASPEKEETKPEVSLSQQKEEPVATTSESTDKIDNEVIRARAQQLSGPKIIGKIQLPVNKKKDQPVASSSNPNTADNKRKRKRKPFPGAAAGAGTAQPGERPNRPQGGQNQPGGGNRPAGGFNR